MGGRDFWVAIGFGMLVCLTASAEPVAVRHLQSQKHLFMTTHSEDGKLIARDEFTQVVRGDDVTMHLVYRFTDGSIDDETTTYQQQGRFRFIWNSHLQKGPFFTKPVDYTIESGSGITTIRTVDRNGKAHVESRHVELPDDLANGFVGTLLLNVAQNMGPFRVGMLAPVAGGRLIRLLISPEGEKTFQLSGQSHKAAIFRIHPELGGIVGLIATLIGVQPKDVMVWVMEGDEPAVVKIVGQLGGYGPVVSSELQGASF